MTAASPAIVLHLPDDTPGEHSEPVILGEAHIPGDRVEDEDDDAREEDSVYGDLLMGMLDPAAQRSGGVGVGARNNNAQVTVNSKGLVSRRVGAAVNYSIDSLDSDDASEEEDEEDGEEKGKSEEGVGKREETNGEKARDMGGTADARVATPAVSMAAAPNVRGDPVLLGAGKKLPSLVEMSEEGSCYSKEDLASTAATPPLLVETASVSSTFSFLVEGHGIPMAEKAHVRKRTVLESEDDISATSIPHLVGMSLASLQPAGDSDSDLLKAVVKPSLEASLTQIAACGVSVEQMMVSRNATGMHKSRTAAQEGPVATMVRKDTIRAPHAKPTAQVEGVTRPNPVADTEGLGHFGFVAKLYQAQPGDVLEPASL
ncbi:hypothetical protein HK101_000908 [Irineochytrium annulatum]|nr:hypothetical protein HK101_000908 [Irineochytrium annulatum]